MKCKLKYLNIKSTNIYLNTINIIYYGCDGIVF